MRPFIGNREVVLHIERIGSIEGVCITLDRILRHLPLAIVCFVEEGSFLSLIVDVIPRSERKAGSS